MMGDEDVEQLRIDAVGVFRDFLDLQTRFDIEVVANVAGLKIQVDHADSAILVRLLQL